jgi:3'(2'), 5'-bisphosphate nucleotidase
MSSTVPPYARELSVALDAAREAASLIEAVYTTDFAVDWKGVGDPVTVADRSANERILERLAAAFPDDAICAEESSTEESSRAAARGGRGWFVDPLDGTREFVARNGEFCVMVGLAVEGRATLGVLVAPAWGRTFVGVVGEGAWEILRDGTRRPLAAPRRDVPQGARLMVSRSHPHARVSELAAGLALQTRPCGSVGLKVASVAIGDADAYVHFGPGPKLWDGCAPEAIARAAGAEVTDALGQPLRYDTAHLPLDGGIVVAAPPLAGALRAALAGRPSPKAPH